MIQPVRIQRSRKKGWVKPDNTVDVSRQSSWGNPYVIGKDGTREEVIERFRKDIAEPMAGVIKNELAGKNLMCWCKLDEPCHADVLLEIANHE